MYRRAQINAQSPRKIALLSRVFSSFLTLLSLACASLRIKANVVIMSKKHSQDYGTPVSGSQTEARGKKAHQRISGEIVELCAIIEDQGFQSDNKISIKFGRLFDIYTVISNKVVGVLLRARKYGFVDFPGETLFQRRDDETVITLLMPASKVKEIARESSSEEFQWGKAIQKSQ